MHVHWWCCWSSCYSLTPHRQISRQVGIFLILSTESLRTIYSSSITRSRDQKLTDSNKKKCFDCCRKLSAAGTQLEWKTSSGSLTKTSTNHCSTICNTQNDRVYTPASVRKKDITPTRCQATFMQQFVDGVCWCRHIWGTLIDAGVYYREIILMQKLLPEIRVLGWFYLSTRHQTITVGPWSHPNSPDLNPVDCKIWSVFQQEVYSQKIQNVDELRQFSSMNGDARTSAWWTIQSNVGVDAFAPVWLQRADIWGFLLNCALQISLLN